MISLEDAQDHVRRACARLAPRPVSVADALGCVLASPVAAAVDVPPFANSAMDGYAVRARDVAAAPVELRVIGRVLAGSTAAGPLGDGEAIRIMTGAPTPPGADAVVMVERTHQPDGSQELIVVEAAVEAGENLRPAGGDVRAGDEVLGAGAFVGPTQLAALVSSGVTEVTVVPRPRVGVISTGDELVDLGQALGAAQIYDSNRPMLLALVAEAGGVAVDLGRSPDDEDALEARIERALPRLDALVLSGGVSVGDVDVVRMVLDRLGRGEARWMQIAIRPAKPFSFTPLAGAGGVVPAFGLPGNPVSSAVGFELLVRPALRAMAGHRATERPRLTARAREDLRRRPDGKTHFMRVTLERDSDSDSDSDSDGVTGTAWVAVPCPGQGSHQIRSMGLADGLAVLPDGDGVVAGGPVEVIVTNAAFATFAGVP
ncbi:MAG: molybdopterin molybdotransferase MoeA [Acidimicrobiales bacterium]